MTHNEGNVLVSLTGGLGNQLFQLAAGLNLAGTRKLQITTTLGSPRLSLEGKVELLSFVLPTRVEILNQKKTFWLTRKAAGFMLRKGVSPSLLEGNKIFSVISQSLANLVMSLHFAKKTKVRASSGVGYSPIHISKLNTLLLGYFQSYRWADNLEVKKELSSIAYFRSSEIIEKYVFESKSERPLIVHVRLGDYLSEQKFGIPSKDFYKIAISSILQIGKCKSIWLFSDELQKAQSYLPADIKVPIRLIPEIEGSPAATLEVMRLGAGYVIANSTFSWWAAFLRKNEEAEIIAPMPWFSGMEDPIDLIPPNWQRINSDFTNSYQYNR